LPVFACCKLSSALAFSSRFFDLGLGLLLIGQVRVLEIPDGFGSRQNGLGLLECLHHLLPGCLADLEILLVIEEFLSLGGLLNLVDLGLGLLLQDGVAASVLWFDNQRAGARANSSLTVCRAS